MRNTFLFPQFTYSLPKNYRNIHQMKLHGLQTIDRQTISSIYPTTLSPVIFPFPKFREFRSIPGYIAFIQTHQLSFNYFYKTASVILNSIVFSKCLMSETVALLFFPL